jgi:hypothetical protein
MKTELDKEMDALLRAQARREATARAHAATAHLTNTPSATHLDADELSAYAENALPATARTRYTAHLADCDSCRTQVVMLARAAGLADRLAQRAEVKSADAPASFWRTLLAAVLAPAAWRVALPAVALLAVSGVALWVINNSRGQREAASTQVASAPASAPTFDQNHTPVEQPLTTSDAKQASRPPTTNAEPAGNANLADKSAAPQAKPAQPGGELIARNEAQEAKAGAIAVAPAAPPVQNAQNYPTQTESLNQNAGVPLNAGGGLNSQSNQTTLAQATPITREYAPEPPASSSTTSADRQLGKESTAKALPKTTAPTDSIKDDEQTYAKRDVRKLEARERDADDASRHGPSRAASRARDESAARAPRGRAQEEGERGSGARRQPKTTAGRAAAAGDADETRSVAGRRFRRQGGAWVDTSYRAGQATVQVRRNTEQWRALIADEPELQRIANALGGEIIVVWGGRAYRIR